MDAKVITLKQTNVEQFWFKLHTNWVMQRASPKCIKGPSLLTQCTQTNSLGDRVTIEIQPS